VFITCADPRLRRAGGRDLVALRVEVGGRRDGQPIRIIYDLIDYYDEAAGVSAMERTTGYSLAITGQLQATGHVFGPGVGTPDRMIPPDAYVEALAERGVQIHRREVSNA
jgi:lysine 6-dehydrogenase